MNSWLNREPQAFFQYFQAISAIPRGSGNEQALSDYLLQFAQSHHLSGLRDQAGNVLIRKPAVLAKTDDVVLLQGHMDMVCEKKPHVNHDFSKDPISLLEKNGFLYADGTTLGADNGVGIAYMLALLSDNTLPCPALECLFTVQEETGMIGAAQWDASLLCATKMINLDAGPDDTLLTGCAGGMRTGLTKSYSSVPLQGHPLRLSLQGLAGGHSGEEIDKCRANAIKLMGRVLLQLSHQTDLCLCTIFGGGKDNAIPRECEAVVAVSDSAAAQQCVQALQQTIVGELSEADSGCSLSCQPTDLPVQMMCRKDSDALIALLNLAPNGVLTMNSRIAGLVESSVNLGVLSTENNEIALTFAPRSSVESLLDDIGFRLELLAKVFGYSCHHSSRYPGWAYQPHSPLRDLFSRCYEQLQGRPMTVTTIHAGLECGLIKSKKPDLDIVSIGPAAYDIHTPDERLELDSCLRLWQLLRAVLQQLALNP